MMRVATPGGLADWCNAAGESAAHRFPKGRLVFWHEYKSFKGHLGLQHLHLPHPRRSAQQLNQTGYGVDHFTDFLRNL
jgi:hypothetical protein